MFENAPSIDFEHETKDYDDSQMSYANGPNLNQWTLNL